MSDHIPDLDLGKMVALLRQHNAWRRDNDGTIDMPNPTELGLAIDAVCEAVCDAVEGLMSEQEAKGKAALITDDELAAWLKNNTKRGAEVIGDALRLEMAKGGEA